jgi:hypothetical protein
MQSERKHTKYLKANDNGDQLRRALNNLIKSALGGEHKLVVALAEALIILNLNTVPSLTTLLQFLENELAKINAEIGEEMIANFCGWLKTAMDIKCKLEFKTPQTQKSRAKTVTRASQDTDSDGNSDEDQRAPRRLTAEEYRRRIQEAIAAKRGAATKR